MDRKAEFLQKLKASMEEYNADISFSVGPCSDTHGLNDEKMVVSMLKADALTPWDFETVVELQGWGFSDKDL